MTPEERANEFFDCGNFSASGIAELIRAAVLEFRERAAKIAEDEKVAIGGDGCCPETCDTIAAAIRGLD